jgi:hypothetical protein
MSDGGILLVEILLRKFFCEGFRPVTFPKTFNEMLLKEWFGRQTTVKAPLFLFVKERKKKITPFHLQADKSEVRLPRPGR